MQIGNQDLYELYKPLRNHLRKASIENVFYVVWAYINFFQFNQPIPKDIQADKSLHDTKNLPNRALQEWELALMAREIVLNGEDNPALASKDFRNWNYFSAAINKLKEFENEAWPIFGGQENILNELRRISHRQFPWQSRTSSATFVKYFKIYNNPRISSIVSNVLGMTVQQWYIVGTALTGALLNHPKFNVDAGIQISNITRVEFDAFLRLTSIELVDLKKIIDSKVRFDDEFVYTLNPLEYYPLIKIGPYYYGPIINFLIWRLTSGIYFDLIKDERFGHPFGLAFQDYLTEVSEKVLNGSTSVLRERKYKLTKSEEDSVDLILLQDQAAIFVEAKAKRMQVRAKSQLVSGQAISKDLEILADDIAQIYATIEDYQKGLYPHLPYDPSRQIYPLLVTLEEWYLIGNDLDTLYKLVQDKLKGKNISEKLLSDCPYVVCSVGSYEHLVQVIKEHPIKSVMNKWFVPEKKGHDFGFFLYSEYASLHKHTDDVFPGDFENIYSGIKV